MLRAGPRADDAGHAEGRNGETERERGTRLQAKPATFPTFSPSIHPFLPPSPIHSLFRTYRTGKQYHRRLTAGWREFVEARNLSVGDVIHFWRDPRDDTGPAPALTMRIKVVRASRGVAHHMEEALEDME